jgi:hypothetical protein
MNILCRRIPTHGFIRLSGLPVSRKFLLVNSAWTNALLKTNALLMIYICVGRVAQQY